MHSLTSYRNGNNSHCALHDSPAAAAAAAKSRKSCLTLSDPRDGSPPGSVIPGILQARTLEWVAISFSNAWKWKGKVKSLSRVRLLATPWTAAYQAPPAMGFSRQEYWSGVPLPSPMTALVLTYNWKFAPSDHLHSILPAHLWSFIFILGYAKRDSANIHPSFIPQNAYLSTYSVPGLIQSQAGLCSSWFKF